MARMNEVQSIEAKCRQQFRTYDRQVDRLIDDQIDQRIRAEAYARLSIPRTGESELNLFAAKVGCNPTPIGKSDKVGCSPTSIDISEPTKRARGGAADASE